MYPADENHHEPVVVPTTNVAGYPIELLPVEPQPQRNSFFFGRFGLRAGYGIAIFLICYVIIGIAAGFSAVAATGHFKEAIAIHAQAKAHPGAPKPKLHLDFVPRLVIVEDGITFFGLLGVCWLFAKGERRRLPVYGIGKHRWRDIFPGAFWGLAAMCLLVAALRALHVLVFDGRALFGSAIVLYGLKWLLAFLLVGFAEEYSFRGYLQFTLTRGVWGLAKRLTPVHTQAAAFWIAATLLSGLFALAHTGNGGENALGIWQVFLAGMTLAYGLWRTGSLWWSIGMHMAWDWAQSFLFGVADSGNVSVGRLFITHPTGNPLLSGGADGPEGSILASVALLLLILVIHFTTRVGAQPSLEQSSRQTVPENNAVTPVA